MQEIITEILERHRFPTKNVGELVVSLETWKLDRLVALSVITNDTEIMAYQIDHTVIELSPENQLKSFISKWRYCSLGSELVARLKGGEG
jgi:hypothetical protein